MITKKELQCFNETYSVLLRSDDFIYILPHHALRSQISNYTITFPSKDIISNNYTVIPHGSATLVFSYDRYGFHSSLFGPMTRPCMVGELANQYDMLFIIEFQPAGFYSFTGTNQKELTNQTFSFELVNPMLNYSILEILKSTSHLDQFISLLNKLLLKHLHPSSPPALQLAAKMILETTGNISCKELSASVYYSQRHLNRMFEQYLGMTAKTFSRMVRINKAIRLMQDSQGSLTCASYETGFYDLPHFIHDFKSVCGITPQEYQNNMSDFYNEIAKY